MVSIGGNVAGDIESAVYRQETLVPAAFSALFYCPETVLPGTLMCYYSGPDSV